VFAGPGVAGASYEELVAAAEEELRGNGLEGAGGEQGGGELAREEEALGLREGADSRVGFDRGPPPPDGGGSGEGGATLPGAGGEAGWVSKLRAGEPRAQTDPLDTARLDDSLEEFGLSEMREMLRGLSPEGRAAELESGREGGRGGGLGADGWGEGDVIDVGGAELSDGEPSEEAEPSESEDGAGGGSDDSVGAGAWTGEAPAPAAAESLDWEEVGEAPDEPGVVQGGAAVGGRPSKGAPEGDTTGAADSEEVTSLSFFLSRPHTHTHTHAHTHTHTHTHTHKRTRARGELPSAADAARGCRTGSGCRRGRRPQASTGGASRCPGASADRPVSAVAQAEARSDLLAARRRQ